MGAEERAALIAEARGYHGTDWYATLLHALADALESAGEEIATLEKRLGDAEAAGSFYLRRLLRKYGDERLEEKGGPWIKLTWQEAEALLAASQAMIAQGYRPNVLVSACAKVREQLESAVR